MENNSEKKVHYDNLDLMKAVAIMLVLTLHVPLWDTGFVEDYNRGRLLQYACRLISEGVPFFLTINGFLLLKKSTLDMRKHIRKMLKIFGILMLWTVILAVTGILLSDTPEMLTIQNVLLTILNTQVGSAYTGVLWFLQNLLGVYFVFPVLWYIYQKDFRIFRYLFVVVSIFVPGMATVGLIRDALACFADVSYLNAAIGFVSRMDPVGNGWYVFYFMLGGIIWHDLDTLLSKRVLWSACGIASWPAAFVVGYFISMHIGFTYNPAYNYASVFMIVFIIGMFALTQPYKNTGHPFKRILADIGKNTFGIYLSHYLFLFIAHKYMTVYQVDYTFGNRLLIWCFALIGSYLFSVVVSRVKYVKWILEL